MATTMLTATCKSTLTQLIKTNRKLLNYRQCFCRYESKISLENHRAKALDEKDEDEDFFGIMRGDGVVEIAKPDEQIDPFRKYERLMRGPEPKEKTFVTSFGSIRFDSDNRPEDDEQWTSRPTLNRKISEIKENYENTIIERHDEEDVSRRRKKMFENISPKNPNYVDDLYFKEMMAIEQHQNENIEKNRATPIENDEKGNYIDQMYFGNVENLIKNDSQQLNETELQNDDDRQKKFDSLKTNEMNYIDQIYFSGPNEEIEKNSEKEIKKEKLKDKKKIKLKQTYENELQITGFTDELDENELIETKEVRKQTTKQKAQNPERKIDEELEKNPQQIINKYKLLNSETALDYVEKVNQQMNKEKIEQGHVVQQVVDIFKEPEYVVLEMLTNSIIYNDNDILAVNKPYGLPCQDGPKCHHNLLKFLPDLAAKVNTEIVYPIHRLDVNATGVLLLAKTETMATYLKSLFKQRKIHKSYYAITRRVPDPPEGIINIPIAEGTISGRRRMVLKPDYNEVTKTVLKKSSIVGQEAKTEYKVISECGNTSLVELYARTGVTHQIRVHLGFGLGCPVLGDHKYTSMTKMVPQKLPDDMLRKLNIRQSKVRDLPLHLHARTISIPEIIDGKNIFIKAPLPTHFTWALKKLKLGSKGNIRYKN